MNLRAKHSSNVEKLQIKLVEYSRRTKKCREEKNCCLFGVFHCAHESESKRLEKNYKEK